MSMYGLCLWPMVYVSSRPIVYVSSMSMYRLCLCCTDVCRPIVYVSSMSLYGLCVCMVYVSDLLSMYLLDLWSMYLLCLCMVYVSVAQTFWTDVCRPIVYVWSMSLQLLSMSLQHIDKRLPNRDIDHTSTYVYSNRLCSRDIEDRCRDIEDT